MKRNPAKEIPVSELHRLFDYDPETGILKWRVKPAKNMVAGTVAGSLTSNGYLSVRVNYQATLVHRICYAMHHGQWPAGLVDHGPLSPVKTDNRAANLRLADKAQNAQNAKKPCSNTSGFKGVCWHKPTGKWFGRVVFRGRQRVAGYFDSLEEAAGAVRSLREALHSEFARHS